MSAADRRIEYWDRTESAVWSAAIAPSDSQLMQSIAAGDESAFETLYERYASTLYAICLRVLRREADAAEVLSEVFLEVWEKAAKYDPQRPSARGFLVTLTRCRSIDRIRALNSNSNHHIQLTIGWGASSRHPEPAEPHHRMVLEEESSMLRQAIGNLSSTQQRVLQMAYFDGLTHHQIADQLDMPLGTVKTAIRRAISLLRNLLLGHQEGTQRAEDGNEVTS